MSQLFLYTNQFPHQGGEPFLEAEIGLIAESFDHVTIYAGAGQQLPLVCALAPNVKLADELIVNPKGIKELILEFPGLFFGWPVKEFFKSPHRFRYISEFRWNLYRFIGLVQKAKALKQALTEVADEATVHYSYWFNEWATILAMAKQMGLKGKIVTRVHGYDFDERQQARGYHPFRYTEWNYIDNVVQVSEYGKNYQLKQFPRSKKLSVSRLGTRDLGTGPVSQDMPFAIVSCSGFVALKRVPLIAEIVSHMQQPVHWFHIGDGREKDSMLQQISKCLAPDKYTFLGAMSNEKVLEYYRTNPVDLFVNASELEGLPVSLMEAASFGIPISGFAICGVPEIVNSETGVLLEETDSPADAAKKWDLLLAEKSRNAEFRSGVKAFWKKEFDAVTNYKEFIKKQLNTTCVV